MVVYCKTERSRLTRHPVDEASAVDRRTLPAKRVWLTARRSQDVSELVNRYTKGRGWARDRSQGDPRTLWRELIDWLCSGPGQRRGGYGVASRHGHERDADQQRQQHPRSISADHHPRSVSPLRSFSAHIDGPTWLRALSRRIQVVSICPRNRRRRPHLPPPTSSLG